MRARRRRRPVSARNDLPLMQRLDLLGGSHLYFPSEAARRRVWQEHREELLAEYAARRPGERPDAWWEYDSEAPEPLRRSVTWDPRVAYDPRDVLFAGSGGPSPREQQRAERLQFLSERGLLARSELAALAAARHMPGTFTGVSHGRT